MTDVKSLIMNKNGMASMQLAKRFLCIKVGEKIPTFSDLSVDLDIARGTLQNAMKLLQSTSAIEVETKGHLGTFLTYKNTKLLCEFADIHSLVGVMPLPYSKHYEGLATGIIASMKNEYELPVNLAYMRGAKKRISMLHEGRYDFAIVSKLAAIEALHEGDSIKMIKEFGAKSYLSNHVLVFFDQSKKEISNHMRVGIDRDSFDQAILTMKVTSSFEVEYVDLKYNQIINKLLAGVIDAAVWNEDEIKDQYSNINYVSIPLENEDDTIAAIIVRDDCIELCHILDEIIDVEKVLSIQQDVTSGKMIPSY